MKPLSKSQPIKERLRRLEVHTRKLEQQMCKLLRETKLMAINLSRRIDNIHDTPEAKP
jgi:hypothetical protein